MWQTLFTLSWIVSKTTSPKLAGQASTSFGDAILAFGGMTQSGGAVSDLWKFEKDTWTKCPQTEVAPERRMYAATTMMSDGTLVICGGWDPGETGSGGVFLNDIWTYHSGMWQRKTSILPDGPASRHTMETLNETHVLVHTFRCDGFVLLYDVANDVVHKQETTGTGPPGLSMQCSAMLANRTLVLFGGTTKDHNMTNSVFGLDTSDWKWYTHSSRDGPTPRASSSMCTLGNSVLIFGGAELQGHYDGGLGLTAKCDLWHFSPFPPRWKHIPLPSNPRPRVTAIMERSPGKVVMSGGWDPATRNVMGDSLFLEIDSDFLK